MKFVVEMPEEQYEAMKGMSIDKVMEYPALMYDTSRRIANGKSLNDVLGDMRAEIESKEMVETTSERGFYNMALNDVLQVIDKYKESEEE